MNLFFKISLITILSLLTSKSGNSQDYLSELKNKSYKEFANHLNEFVQIEISRNKQMVSKEEAIRLIKNRINKLNPVRWELVHSGESEEKDGNYMVLKAYNEQEEGLRIFIHVKKNEGKRKISSIRFSKLL